MYGREVLRMPPAVTPQRAVEYVGDRQLVIVMFPTDDERFRDRWGVFEGDVPDGFREIARSGQVIALERPSPVP